MQHMAVIRNQSETKMRIKMQDQSEMKKTDSSSNVPLSHNQDLFQPEQTSLTFLSLLKSSSIVQESTCQHASASGHAVATGYSEEPPLDFQDVKSDHHQSHRHLKKRPKSMPNQCIGHFQFGNARKQDCGLNFDGSEVPSSLQSIVIARRRSDKHDEETCTAMVGGKISAEPPGYDAESEQVGDIKEVHGDGYGDGDDDDDDYQDRNIENEAATEDSDEMEISRKGERKPKRSKMRNDCELERALSLGKVDAMNISSNCRDLIHSHDEHLSMLPSQLRRSNEKDKPHHSVVRCPVPTRISHGYHHIWASENQHPFSKHMTAGAVSSSPQEAIMLTVTSASDEREQEALTKPIAKAEEFVDDSRPTAKALARNSNAITMHAQTPDSSIGTMLSNGARLKCPKEGCSRTFSCRSHLVRHQRAHTKSRPFECPYCTANFADSSVLHRHVLRRHHRLPFPCPQCQQEFARERELRDHLDEVHHIEVRASKGRLRQMVYRVINEHAQGITSAKNSDQFARMIVTKSNSSSQLSLGKFKEPNSREHDNSFQLNRPVRASQSSGDFLICGPSLPSNTFKADEIPVPAISTSKTTNISSSAAGEQFNQETTPSLLASLPSETKHSGNLMNDSNTESGRQTIETELKSIPFAEKCDSEMQNIDLLGSHGRREKLRQVAQKPPGLMPLINQQHNQPKGKVRQQPIQVIKSTSALEIPTSTPAKPAVGIACATSSVPEAIQRNHGIPAPQSFVFAHSNHGQQQQHQISAIANQSWPLAVRLAQQTGSVGKIPDDTSSNPLIPGAPLGAANSFVAPSAGVLYDVERTSHILSSNPALLGQNVVLPLPQYPININLPTSYGSNPNFICASFGAPFQPIQQPPFHTGFALPSAPGIPDTSHRHSTQMIPGSKLAVPPPSHSYLTVKHGVDNFHVNTLKPQVSSTLNVNIPQSTTAMVLQGMPMTMGLHNSAPLFLVSPQHPQIHGASQAMPTLVPAKTAVALHQMQSMPTLFLGAPSTIPTLPTQPVVLPIPPQFLQQHPQINTQQPLAFPSPR